MLGVRKDHSMQNKEASAGHRNDRLFVQALLSEDTAWLKSFHPKDSFVNWQHYPYFADEQMRKMTLGRIYLRPLS